MHRHRSTWLAMLFLLLPLLIIAGIRTGGATAGRQLAILDFELVASGLGFITDVEPAADGRLFVTTKGGAIRVVESDGTVLATPFMDISGQIIKDGEHGLLSMELHPDHVSNREFFLTYSDMNQVSIVARYLISDTNPNVGIPSSAEVILEIPQPYSNHNVGELLFGPDGMLYIAVGDGGGSGDIDDQAQDKTTLLGTILRLDVDGGSPYAIPDDNPFKGDGGGVKEEIWAYGLRNPWRVAFDPGTDDFYIGDVGQWSWEEIDYEPAGFPGGANYGWRCYEGLAPFDTTGCGQEDSYDAPIYVISNETFCAVLGGHVYRGADTRLSGIYLLADICSGDVRGIIRENDSWRLVALGTVPDGGLNTFAQDGDGEVYVASRHGTIYKIGVSTMLALDQAVFLPIIH